MASARTEGYLSNMISDSNAGLAYMLANFPADPKRLGILGYSVGGRIALTIAATGEQPLQGDRATRALVRPGKTLALFFAGSEAEFERLYAEAPTDKGDADYTTIYGQKQQLSKRWFDELLASHPDETIAVYKGPMLVVHGDKDTVIQQPEVDMLLTPPPPNSSPSPTPTTATAFTATSPK